MRPEILTTLFSSLISLSGVGPESSRRLENLVGSRVFSLLCHCPTGVIQRRLVDKLSMARPSDVVTLLVSIDEHVKPPKGKRLPYRVRCSDKYGGRLDLVFFHPQEIYLLKILPSGQERAVSGKVEYYQSRWQMIHPDHIGHPLTLKDWQGPEPQYPLTQGLTQKMLRKFIDEAFKRCVTLPEWISEKIKAKAKWLGWRESLVSIHNPQKNEEINPFNLAYQRLAYDELLANQLSLQLIRQTQIKSQGRPIIGNGELRKRAIDSLPFQLTEHQRSSLEEIFKDMAEPKRMVRLLQGDVGSGKTIVAFLALLNAVEAGLQGAYLAPTEILARQHYQNMKRWANKIGVSVGLLTGKDRKSERDEVLKCLQDHSLKILVGTHALIQEGVVFKDLGLAVIDEQHRFGVSQRLQLSQKGQSVDTLVMTATPIPRTLMMTTHGDLDCSFLRQKPSGRKDIVTKAISTDRLREVIEALKREINRGGKIYWVCPLVEESEVLDLTSVEDRALSLETHFKGKVGLIHGRIKSTEKEKVMTSFIGGDIKILVATTVIEVGVHVDDATVMVIEHADRFGLAQLHQLRGRVGRGEQQATCLLLYQGSLNSVAQARLQIMRQSNDGFRIAEEDLKLRGGGEILGLKQSGMANFRFANLEFHQNLLNQAHEDAKEILIHDPFLLSERGKALRILLALYEQDAAVQYLQAG